jgi:two-component system cell cycle sensor histidine kinase/response regulator CckA
MSAAKRPDTHASLLAAFISRLLGRHAQTNQRERQSAEVVAQSAYAGPEPLSTAQYVHDVRNLLQVILVHADGMAHQLPEGTADTEYRELLRAMERASLLTRELLLAGRPGSAKRGRVDVNRVIRESVETVRRLVGGDVRVNLRLSVESATVIAGAYEVERILLNLALNARDAMPDGGTLTFETAVIPGSAWKPPSGVAEAVDSVRLRVSDTGHGMTPEVKARIAEPFFTTRKMGTGLGLSSVELTVRHLDGTITLESQPNVGTRVTIQLPFAAPSEPPMPLVPPQSSDV